MMGPAHKLELDIQVIAKSTVIDQTVVDVATATEQYAGYASFEKQHILQKAVAALHNVMDVQIRAVLDGSAVGTDHADLLVNVIMPLLATTNKLTIRPVAYPSAVMCLSTAHKAVMLLEMLELPKDFKETQKQWVTAVKGLGKSNTKWAKLKTTVPGSLVRFVRARDQGGC